MSETAFPPTGPTTLQNILPAYVYAQYSDDDNIQAFNAAFNGLAQVYLNWFNTVNLPVYTVSQTKGALLDWVAQGIYGLSRPALPYGFVEGIGPLGTWELGTWVLGTFTNIGTVSEFTTSDDTFKRILTWYFYKGDGQQYSTLWLKRRVMRFLTGARGQAVDIDNTYPISVTYTGNGAAVITITLGGVITQGIANVFSAAVQSGAIPLPFQMSFTVSVVS
jgi:hypothetical protein